MNGRQRVQAMFDGAAADRIPVYEHIWNTTVERWKTEGLPEDADVARHFGFDVTGYGWPDLSLRFEPEVLEETDDYVIEKNADGMTVQRHKEGGGHTPHWIDWTLRDRETWERYKERLNWDDDRVDWDRARELHDYARANGMFLLFMSTDAYESFWSKFGQVQTFQLMLDDPDLIAEVAMTYAELIVEAAKAYRRHGLDFDGGWQYGDVGYRNGLLFSPQCFRDLIKPANKTICDYFNGIGKPVILHSCGQIKSLIPDFIEIGYSGLNPLEAKCDQDLRDLHPKYGKDLVWVGNFDVRKLSGTKEEVREEVLGKLEFLAENNGRLIFHSDHSLPTTVSYENYAYALELVRGFKVF